MSKKLVAILLLPCAIALMAAKVTDVSEALDSPAGVAFLSVSGTVSKETKYSNDHIGNWETGKKETVYPVRGGNFLKMNGGSNSTKESRLARIASSFSFEVKGAGTLNFQHRVATSWNEDILVIYEDDIDDPLLELWGESWCKKETLDGETYYDLYAEDFWIDEDLNFSTEKYTRRITVALLAPLKDEMYVPPDADEIVNNCAYLDAFVWTPDEDATICGFSTDELHASRTFGREGMTVYLTTDYVTDVSSDEEQSSEEVDYQSNWLFDYWYTCDGSAPARNGKKSFLYDEQDGIELSGDLAPGTVTVRVAVYEGATKIGDYSQSYTRKANVQAPTVAKAELSADGAAIAFTLACVAPSQNLTYYYTDDGSEPTFDSPQAEGAVLTAAAAGVYTVIAREGQDQSVAPLKLVVEKGQKPTIAVVSDGQKGNLVFSRQCVVSATGGAAMRYSINGGATADYQAPLTLTESAEVAFAVNGVADRAKALYRLAGEASTVSVTRETADSGAWVTEQVANFTDGSWNVLAVPRRLSQPRAQELIAWLHPFAYNSATRSLELATSLEGGAAYLVHPAMIEEANRPASYADGGEAPPLAGKGSSWVLSAAGAQAVWNGKSWVMQPREGVDFPGWRR